ncbi:hypothetical protein LSH36_37g14022 [Paralvinella palmiformis]|uniref:Ubiquitin carboxyl-terminal hydrolase n=1 Tax=Paralvinella palmiformis TaxID=53620 RepID=A0AAD9NFR9_9ANNE|nr:hypothetical protein LSH36_37g14022 [Paralvinella palmiformis]
MSRNIQGITFGFFEDLPADDKSYLEDILYGSKAHSVKIELPWEEQLQLAIEQEEPPPVIQNSPPQLPNSSLPSGIPDVLKAPNVSLAGDMPAGGGDVLQLTAAAPPGIHQPMYPIPVAVPPNMIPVVGVYQQSSVPISYVSVLPPQSVILQPQAVPSQDPMLTTVKKLPTVTDEDQFSDGSNKMHDKESTKILGGKTYERRNKKKRPANYYENLERKHTSEDPGARQEPCPGGAVCTSGLSQGQIRAPEVMNANMMHPAVVDVHFPPPGVPTSQQHGVQQVAESEVGGAVRGVILPQGLHSVHYECPISLKPECSPTGVAIENVHVCEMPVSQVAAQQQVYSPIPDVQSSETIQGKNTSLSSEIYTDGRRTVDNQFMFNDVTDHLDAVSKENAANVSAEKGFSEDDTNKSDGGQTDITFGTVSLSDGVPTAITDYASTTENLPPTSDHVLGVTSEPQQTATETPSVTVDCSVPSIGSVSHVETTPAQTVAASTPESGDAQNLNSATSSESGPKSPHSTSINSSATQPPLKPKSWAELFQSTNSSPSVIYNNVPPPISDDVVSKKQATKLPETVTPEKDVAIQELGAFLKSYQLCYKPPALQPRGLINKGNWCYVNATLQALLACAPFCNLMRSLPSHPLLQRGPTSTPVLDSIIEFINEFSSMPPGKPQDKNNKGKGNVKYDIPTGPIFEPTYVYKMLQVIKYDGFKGGKQEDAEEFLSCLLNGLHDEMVAAMKIENIKKSNDGTKDDLSEDELVDDAGWEQVGPKNKSVVTRSPMTVHTVQEALNNLVSKEQLQDFTCSKTKMEVDASRRTLLEELPAILLLHLKCFVYDKNGGCQKVVKQLDFSAMLDIHKDLLSSAARSHYPPAQRRYKLFAVVKHIGVRSAGGHYVADIYHQSLGEWVHYDDNIVHVVSLPQVFKFRHPRVPYLLYYRRADLS